MNLVKVEKYLIRTWNTFSARYILTWKVCKIDLKKNVQHSLFMLVIQVGHTQNRAIIFYTYTGCFCIENYSLLLFLCDYHALCKLATKLIAYVQLVEGKHLCINLGFVWFGLSLVPLWKLNNRHNFILTTLPWPLTSYCAHRVRDYNSFVLSVDLHWLISLYFFLFLFSSLTFDAFRINRNAFRSTAMRKNTQSKKKRENYLGIFFITAIIFWAHCRR